MSTRPSGLPLIPAEAAEIVQEVASVDERGRINLLPRWLSKANWTPSQYSELLMIFDRPGLVLLRQMEPDANRVITLHAELAASDDPEKHEKMRQIQDRYAKLTVDRSKRAHLGDSALQHLGFPTTRGTKSPIYVVIAPNRIDLLSPSLRNEMLLQRGPEFDDLP